VCGIEFKGGRPGLTISLAGHPPPLFLGSTGEVKALGKEGTLLGGVEDPIFADVSVLLEPNDVPMFFTDGAMDRYDSGTRGLEEHLAAIGGKEDLNAEELADSMVEFVVNRRLARWADDLALLVVKEAK
jgi:phosphoserine phosphatase RsbU/P